MTISIENLFKYLAAISDFIIVVWFIFIFERTKKDKKIQVIALYCICALVLNYINQVLPKSEKYLFYTFYTIVEYLIFCSFFWKVIISRKMKNMLIYLSAAFIAFIIGFTFLANHTYFDSVSIGIETILIILYSFYFLYQEMKETKEAFIYSKYTFWIMSGMLIYLSGSFFIYIFATQLNPSFLYNYWFITNAFYIFKNVFFAIAIILYLRQLKTKNSPKGISYTLMHHRS
jgi:hypothetical protein